MAKTGRPTSYSQNIADAICEEIATTDHSLCRICDAEGMPSPSTVYLWLTRVSHHASRELILLGSPHGQLIPSMIASRIQPR